MRSLKPDKPRGLLMGPQDGVSTHARYQASPDLAEYLEHFWAVSWDLRDKPPFKAETLPHPSVHLVIGSEESTVTGIVRGRFITQLAGTGWVFGIKFRPGMFAPFLGRAVSSIADRRLPLASLGPLGTSLMQSVSVAASDTERADRAEAALRRHMPAADPRAVEARAMVELISSDRTILKVEDLSARLLTSTRALQRTFSHYVGVSPKWVIQRYRLHEAAERLAAGTADGARLALELGYTDQAHFIRAFKAVVGVAPGTYSRIRLAKRTT